MHRPSHFMRENPSEGFAVIREHPLAQLVVVDDAGRAHATPVPLIADTGTSRLIGHLARPNPLVTIGGGEALVVFSGSDAYVSPSYYPSKRTNPEVVPTWNYSTVQIRGTLTMHPDAQWTEWVVRRLTAHFESDHATPWSVDDAPENYVSKMVKGIVGIEIDIREMSVKLKLSQNKSHDDRRGVSEALDHRSPTERDVSAAMRELRPSD